MEEIAYAQVDGDHVAYRVMEGSGSIDVLMVSGTFFPLDMLTEDRVTARFIDGLVSLGRLVMFDKRGVGLSDPITDWSRAPQHYWADDIIAIVEHAGLRDPVVVSWEALGPARLAAARRPDVFGRLVLINPTLSLERFMWQWEQAVVEGGDDPVGALERRSFPSRIDDPTFRDWLARSGRLGASPAIAKRMWDEMLRLDVPMTPDGIDVPTLVIHRADCIVPVEDARLVADTMGDAELVQVSGADMYPIAGDVDALVAEIASFALGAAQLPPPERALAAVLFTDLVGSTEHAADVGDARWRELLDAHDRIVRRCVGRMGGRVVKYTGDGVLALMPSATSALLAAAACSDQLGVEGLGIRSGVHVGDVDQRGDDVSGLAVNVAARIMDTAAGGEVLVSDAVRTATVGSGLAYEDAGTTELKGVPGTWQLHRWVR